MRFEQRKIIQKLSLTEILMHVELTLQWKTNDFAIIWTDRPILS